jgi:hypothetical protein
MSRYALPSDPVATGGELMGRTWLCVMMTALVSQVPASSGDSALPQAKGSKREQLLETYFAEADRYAIYRDASRKERVDREREPVFVWTNVLGAGDEYGAVFVWTCRGRAELIGTFFSLPEAGQRKLCHEFHSLSLSTLDVSRSGSSPWVPEAAGIDLTPIAGAPAPASSAPRRLVQMRALAHDFTATTLDRNERRWELRLLPQPLYRYQSTDPDVLDGALFGFVNSAGTDPEALLVIEARKPSAAGDPIWQYALGRFTDLDLAIRHKGKDVFHVPLVPYDAARQDPKQRYHVFFDRFIPQIDDKAP